MLHRATQHSFADTHINRQKSSTMRLSISVCHVYSVCRWLTVTLCTSHYCHSRFQEFSFTRSLLWLQKYANENILRVLLFLYSIVIIASWPTGSACSDQRRLSSPTISYCVSQLYKKKQLLGLNWVWNMRSQKGQVWEGLTA